jgi:phospholipid-transporting ATPase
LNTNSQNFSKIEGMLLNLALNHSILIGSHGYLASSPDELALVNAAKFFGAEFKKRDEDNNMIITFLGKEYRYRLLNILEFTSARKRMSVIVEDAQGNYLLFCKGADSIIEKRLNITASVHLAETKKHVDFFAEEGLRTLFLAKKRLTRS